MVGPSASEVLFIAVSQSITLMGKVWLIVMIFLRILMLLFAGFPLYQDEQERFVCNTIQPGCANMCYDLFSPISLFRFWLVQLISVCLPYIIFVIYVVHKVSYGLSMDNSPNCQLTKLPQESFRKLSPVAEQNGGTQAFTGAYILHLFFRTLLEAGFGAAHYYLFGFYIPRRFLCQHAPCTTQVDCYISRPTEKTVMLNFMHGSAALSLFLNVLDFLCAVKRTVRQKSKRKMMVEKIFEEEQSILSAGASKGTDSKVSSPHQNHQGESVQTGSFRKRHCSKDSYVGVSCNLSQEADGCSQPCSPGAPGCNTNGNNVYLISQEDAVKEAGSVVALCPLDVTGTPRSIRVSKRSRLKPPPPPRRDLGFLTGASGAPGGEASTAAGVCTRRMGQYALVDLSNPEQSNEDGQEKRSEWV